MIFNTKKIKKIENDISNILHTFPQQNRCEKIIFSPCFKKMLSEKIARNYFSHKYKVISLNEIINFACPKSQPSFLRRVIESFVSTLLGLTPKIGSIISISITITNIVKDFLGEIKTNEIEKYINSNWKKKKYYKKVKYIIYVDDSSCLSNTEIACLQLLSYLISQKYLVNVAILISQPTDLMLPHICDCVELYRVDAEDILCDSVDKDDQYVKNSLFILNIVGIENVEKINYALNQKSNTNKTIETIVNAIWADKGIKPCRELESFLNSCSMLFEQFELRDVEYISKIQNNEKYRQLFDIAKDAEIIKEINFQIFFFLQPFLREYYQKKNFTYPSNFYKNVYKYLEKNYPDQYDDLAIAIKNLSSNNDEILSKNILAYYFCGYTMSSYKLSKITENLKAFKLGDYLVKLDQIYQNHKNDTEIQIMCETYFDLLEQSNISFDAKLAALSYGTRLYYELDVGQDELINISKKYRKLFAEIRIFSNRLTKNLNFALDFIAFSTCIESDYATKEVVQRLVPLLQGDMRDIQRNKYLRFLRLGNVIYGNSSKEAELLLKKGYIQSKGNCYLNSLAGINYSTALIVQGKFDKSNDILETIVSHSDKDSIIYISAYNNYLISKFLSKTFNAEKNVKLFSAIDVENFQSDSCIVKNNLVSFQILSGKMDFQTEIQLCNRISGMNDVYHNFFAKHNIMVIFFLTKDSRFWNVMDNIQFPALLSEYQEIFLKKYTFLKYNFHQKWNIYQLTEELNNWLSKTDFTMNEYSSYYNLPVLFGLIERWFE